jgi:hypothetical protein
MKKQNLLTAMPYIWTIVFGESYMKRPTLYRVLSRYLESIRGYNRAIALNPYSEYVYDKDLK